jgi:peroxiredoxin
MQRLTLPLILLITLAGCAPTAPEATPEEATRVHVGDSAPAFEGRLMDGTPFSLEDQRGNVVVLSFFATWCPPCRKEIPHLEAEVWQRFQGPGFTLAAIAREHKASELGEFITDMKMTFPVIPDPDRSIFSLFADAFIPRTIIIDPEGTVIYHGNDFKPEEFAQMVELIEKTLAANSPPPTEDNLTTDHQEIESAATG